MGKGSEDDSVTNKDCSLNESVKINENSNNVAKLIGSGCAQTNESSEKRKPTDANEGPAKKRKR